MQVDLALNILDGAPFREDPSQVIRVQRAKFEQKGSDYVPKKKGKSKKKAAGVLSKQEKELGWGGFDDKLAANKVSSLNSGRLASRHVMMMMMMLFWCPLVVAQGQCFQQCNSKHCMLLRGFSGKLAANKVSVPITAAQSFA